MESASAGIVEGNVSEIIAKKFFDSSYKNGVFVDVGAATPDYLSICSYYRPLGWRILAIEPNPEFCKLWQQKGFEVLQYACGDHDEDDVDFQVVNSHGADYLGGQVSFESFSSLKIKDSYARLQPDNLDFSALKVKLRTLNTIMAEHAPHVSRIDILSVDVEGWELEVLAGLNLDKYQPRVMVIENIFNDPAYRDYCKRFGYVLWKNIAPNDIYISRSMNEHMRRFSIRLRSLLGRNISPES